MSVYGIVGTRTFNNYLLLEQVLDEFQIQSIVSGGADGADSLAILYAKKKNLEYKIYEADWNQYGRAAGPIRNEEIVENSDTIVAFWDGQSKGTLSTINIAERKGKKVHIVRYQ